MALGRQSTTVTFNGIAVTKTTLEQAADDLLDDVAMRRNPTAVRLVNSYTMALADTDAKYHMLLRGEGVNLPDGRPLVAALNSLSGAGGRYRQVRGPSFFRRCLDVGRKRQVKHFFLGGSDELLASLVDRCKAEYPGIRIAGFWSPPFRTMGEDEIAEQDRMIETSGADLIWVGLGTPKQDFEARRLSQVHDRHAVGVGAAFDFLAGTKLEAPRLVRRVGLEWLFRLATEPRRLWRRYLFGNVGFLRLVVRERRRMRGE